MRFARLFDRVSPSGEPYFAPDRARIADPEERARIAAFLRSGAVIRRVTARDGDRLDLGPGRVVPMSTRTDGTWIWNESLCYRLEAHGVAPDPDFLATSWKAGTRRTSRTTGHAGRPWTPGERGNGRLPDNTRATSASPPASRRRYGGCRWSNEPAAGRDGVTRLDKSSSQGLGGSLSGGSAGTTAR